MGGNHDVCHYTCNCSSFKASVLLHLCCSPQLTFVKILSVFFMLRMPLFFNCLNLCPLWIWSVIQVKHAKTTLDWLGNEPHAFTLGILTNQFRLGLQGNWSYFNRTRVCSVCSWSTPSPHIIKELLWMHQYLLAHIWAVPAIIQYLRNKEP